MAFVTNSVTTSATSSYCSVRSQCPSVLRTKSRAPETDRSRGGSAHEAEPETEARSGVGSPSHKGSSTLGPSVPNKAHSWRQRR
ncbi:hypothetical protein STAL104432_26385 [Streptomyces albus]